MKIFNKNLIESVDDWTMLSSNGNVCLYSGLSYDDAIVELRVEYNTSSVNHARLDTQSLLSLDNVKTMSAGVIAF